MCYFFEASRIFQPNTNPKEQSFLLEDQSAAYAWMFIIIVLDRVLLRGKRRSVTELAGTQCTSLGVSMETNPPHWYGKLPDRIWVKRHNERVLSRSGSPAKILNMFKQVVQVAKNVENVSYVAIP